MRDIFLAGAKGVLMVLTRREREAELARSGFMDAAMQVFSRKGFHGATMDEIARTAGYSAGAIYRYFRNKDEIFHAVVQRMGDAFLAQVQEEPPVKLGFEDRLRWFLSRHFAIAEDHRDFFVTFVARNPVLEWDAHSELGAEACAFHEAVLDGVTRMMELGLAEGALRPGDPREYAQVFKGLMRALTLDWMTGDTSMPLDGRAARIIDLFLHGAGRPKAA